MNKFLSLMKITLIDQLNLNKLFKKDKILSKIIMIILVIALYLLITLSIGISFYGLGVIGKDTIGVEVVLNLGLFITSLLLITTTLTRANAYLFKAKDFDILSSLSIPLSTIVFSKILSFLLFSYLITSIVYIPTIIVYGLLSSVGFLFYLLSFIIFLLFPLLVVSVFSVISYLLSLLFSRFKYKNLVSVVLNLALFIGIMYVSFSLQGTADESTLVQINKVSNITKYMYFPASLAFSTLTNNYISLLWLIIISLIPFILFVYLTGKVYVYVNTTLSYTKKSNNFSEKLISNKENKVGISLFRLELKKLFSIPIYVINSLSTKIVAVILGISFLLNSNLTVEGTELVIDSKLVPIIFLVIISFMIGVTTTTSATISLEGKSFWILKTLPVDSREIIWSKIYVDVLFSLITVTILIVALGIFTSATILSLILIFVILLLLTTSNAIIGMLCNLKNYNFNWDQPVKVVKQGTSVILTMLINMGLGILIAGLLLALAFGTKLDIHLILLLTVLFGALILSILVYIINRFGVSLFNKIKA